MLKQHECSFSSGEKNKINIEEETSSVRYTVFHSELVYAEFQGGSVTYIRSRS